MQNVHHVPSAESWNEGLERRDAVSFQHWSKMMQVSFSLYDTHHIVFTNTICASLSLQCTLCALSVFYRPLGGNGTSFVILGDLLHAQVDLHHSICYLHQCVPGVPNHPSLEEV